MVDGAMLVAGRKDGGLLARVSPEDDEALLERPEAQRAEMGNGRSMGAGWMTVDADALDSDEALDFWLDHCLRRLDAA